MNNSAARYKSKLKRKLQCSHGTKARLVEEFSHSLNGFLEENPDASFADLSNAFGPPEEMARMLMEEVDEKELRSYKTKHSLLRIVSIVLALTLVLVTAAVFFIKQKPLQVVNGGSIVDSFVIEEGE